MNNQMELSFLAVAQNEAFARMVISAFLVQTNPTLSVVSEVRTAVSEAVTNAIVHAYTEKSGKVILRAWIDEDAIRIEVEDMGRGIENIEQAMQPFYTTAAGSGEDRHGLCPDAVLYGQRPRAVLPGKRNPRFYAETAA